MARNAEVDLAKAPSWYRDTMEEITMSKAPSWFRDFFKKPEVDEEEESRVQSMEVEIENKVSGNNDFEIELANVISSGESPKYGYDSWYGRGTRRGAPAPPKPPTQMTVREVLDWQAKSNPPGPGTNAVGRYQIVNIPNAPTMSEVVQQMGLTGDEMFDKTTQDKMFLHLLKKRGYEDFKKGKLTWDQFANNLAKEWASLPVVTATRRGRVKLQPGSSYYSGDGVNKAHIPLDKFTSVFELADFQTASIDDNKEEG